MSQEQKVLTKDIAQQYSDGKLDIYTSRFSSVDPEAAEILVSASPVDNLVEEGCEPGLYLNGLTELSEDVATALAKVGASRFEESRIYLSGLKSLSVPAAKALANCRATLDLSGLTSISDDVAEALGQHVGCLYLDGLSNLSDSSAEHIARHMGLVRLLGLKTISDPAAAALTQDPWPVKLNISILSETPDQTALRAKVQAPTCFVEIGITDPTAEVFGATKFEIGWDLDSELVTEAGFDIDWARGSVMYDFATGRAWNLEILKELIEKGVAVPYLDADFCVYGPGGLKATGGLANYGSMFTEEGQEVCSDFEPDQDKVVDIIRRVHAHALELIALKDTNHAS